MKCKKLCAILAIFVAIMAVAVINSDVYAIYTAYAFYTEFSGYSVCPGETVTINIKTNGGVTDFSFYKSQMCVEAIPASWYTIEPVMEGVQVINGGNIVYYSQGVEEEDKVAIPSGTTIVKFVVTIPEDYDFEMYGNYVYVAPYITFSRFGNEFVVDDFDRGYITFGGWANINMSNFKKGDIDRNLQVDFFDITTLIDIVYNKAEDYVWTTELYQAAKINKKNQYFIDYELEYLEAAEKVDFFDIVNLISYVYDECQITYNLNGGHFVKPSEAVTKYCGAETTRIQVPGECDVEKEGYYLDYIKFEYTCNGKKEIDYLNSVRTFKYFEFDSTLQNCKFTYYWRSEEDAEDSGWSEYFLYNDEQLLLRVGADGLVYKPNGKKFELDGEDFEEHFEFAAELEDGNIALVTYQTYEIEDYDEEADEYYYYEYDVNKLYMINPVTGKISFSSYNDKDIQYAGRGCTDDEFVVCYYGNKGHQYDSFKMTKWIGYGGPCEQSSEAYVGIMGDEYYSIVYNKAGEIYLLDEYNNVTKLVDEDGNEIIAKSIFYLNEEYDYIWKDEDDTEYYYVYIIIGEDGSCYRLSYTEYGYRRDYNLEYKGQIEEIINDTVVKLDGGTSVELQYSNGKKERISSVSDIVPILGNPFKN